MTDTPKLFRRFVLPVVSAILIVLVWLALGSAFLLGRMSPAVATLWVALVGAAFLWMHAYRRGVRAHAERVVLLRPLGVSLRWVILAIPAMLLFQAFLLVILLRITGLPEPAPNPIVEYLRIPGGWIPLALFLGVVVPIVEEFGFRGWIQRRFERASSPAVAITLTAFIFAVAHLQLLGLPTRFVAGVVFGYAVWASRSIWAAVILHSAHNLSLVLPAAFAPETSREPQLPGLGTVVMALFGLLFTAAWLVWLGMRLREGENREPLAERTEGERSAWG